MDIKEILVLHHSHFDIGFTHAQPVLWELQREFIDGALDLLKETEDWPEVSKPRWTIEATGQVLKWLETATGEDIENFKKFASKYFTIFSVIGSIFSISASIFVLSGGNPFALLISLVILPIIIVALLFKKVKEE